MPSWSSSKTIPLLTLVCLSVPFPSSALDRSQLDHALAPYQKVGGIAGGTLSSIGSDTFNNLMTLWAEDFSRQYPGVRIQIEGKGSNTAPPALIEGTAQLAPMSRRMKASEVAMFEMKFGYKPMGFPVAIDALAIYVNKQNPLQGLTLDQVDAAFSKSRRLGHEDHLRTWGQLGLTGEWAAVPITLYGRNAMSGTYEFFKEQALKNGDFKDEVKEQPGSASVVQGVTEDRYGMGYSGVGYVAPGVRMVPLAERAGLPYVEPTQAHARNGSYPLWRYLYIYVNQVPNRPLSPTIREFLRFVYSREGQADVLKDGYFPLSGDLAKREVTRLR
jgi:phosphate transport system substrate-binding protein